MTFYFNVDMRVFIFYVKTYQTNIVNVCVYIIYTTKKKKSVSSKIMECYLEQESLLKNATRYISRKIPICKRAKCKHT